MGVFGFDVRFTSTDEAGGPFLERMSVAFERAGFDMASFGDKVFPKLVPVFEAEAREQFDAEGHGPRAGRFEPLSEMYRQWKEDRYPGKPILQRTGAMFEGLTESSSPFATRRYDSSSFDFGTSGLDYASYHQTGTSRMPARPPFDFTDQLQTDLVRAGRDGIEELLDEAGVRQYAGTGGAD